MIGLIQKSGYIKPGSGGGSYARYIATRDGVELIEKSAGEGYLAYIAERPRSHGLFSADGAANLEQTLEVLNGHTGPVWTFVYSFRRADAARLGYENGESWRSLVLAHRTELAEAMKIPPKDFRWCAAFHDEKHHPHIHMIVWSENPGQGYLTGRGIEQMRSQLSNDIFQDELLSLYQQKDLSYQQVRDAAMESMARLVREMKSNLCDSPVIAEQMETLVGLLGGSSGKKVYGYLRKQVKEQVDAIVDELAKVPEVAACYEQWNQLRDELERYYKDMPREHKLLSQQKEFKAIKNMVIREAENLRLGVLPDDEQAELWFRRAAEAGHDFSRYALGKLYLTGEDVAQDREQAYSWFRHAAEQGNTYAQFFLDHADMRHRPNVLLAATKLLHHMGQIFGTTPCRLRIRRIGRWITGVCRNSRKSGLPWGIRRTTMRSSSTAAGTWEACRRIKIYHADTKKKALHTEKIFLKKFRIRGRYWNRVRVLCVGDKGAAHMGYYMNELYQRYFRVPDLSELKEDIEHTRQEVRDCLD